MKKIILLAVTFFLLNTSVSVTEEYLSKDPNSINRGKFWGGKALIVNYKKSELHKHNYRIILDPTGTSPFKKVESFSPKKGDCGNHKHWGGKSGGVTDCNTGRLRLEVTNSVRLSKRLVKKKPRERWYGYYVYIPNDFPEDQYLQPYINQFYGYNKGTRGGYSPQISASIYKNKFTVTGGTTIIDEDSLKGRWHKIEYHFKWSVNNDGFIKVYHNSELKLNRTGFTTMNYDFVEFKYGTYNNRDYGYTYPENYQFPGHTIYFSGLSVSEKREQLKVNNIK